MRLPKEKALQPQAGCEVNHLYPKNVLSESCYNGEPREFGDQQYLGVLVILSCVNIKAWNGSGNSTIHNHVLLPWRARRVAVLPSCSCCHSWVTVTQQTQIRLSLLQTTKHSHGALMAAITNLNLLITSSSKAFCKQPPLCNEPCSIQKSQYSPSFYKLG